MAIASLSELPDDVRSRAEAMVSPDATHVHVERHEPVAPLREGQGTYRVYVFQGDRFVSAHFTVLADGQVRENTRALLRSRIVNVEIREAAGGQDIASIHVLDDEQADGSTYSTNLPGEVARALIRIG